MTDPTGKPKMQDVTSIWRGLPTISTKERRARLAFEVLGVAIAGGGHNEVKFTVSDHRPI